MTLDEAIKHAEEVAAEQDKLCKRYDDASGYSRSHNESIRVDDAKWCERCAKEHRQLAEWLKELKQLRQQATKERKEEPCEDAVSREYLLDDSKYHTVFNDDTGAYEDVVYREDIKNAPPVKVVSLEKVKQARKEIAKYQSVHDSYCEHIKNGDHWEGHTPDRYESSGGKATACDYFLQILDKLIKEVDG
ncbi:MAG: hypothetical protein K5819_07840 [Lachnospiraceae bacterium]|nr:hypothetical protein [Lachnospiraceae bacterium]